MTLTPDEREPRVRLAFEAHPAVPHEWGEIEYAHFTGNPHRKCQIEGCRFVSLDLHEED